MLPEPLLTILITNYNTSPFIELLLQALHTLTHSSHRILINDNGSQPQDIQRLLRAARRHPNVFIHFRSATEKIGALAHGKALDILMSHVTTPYTAVFDSDAVVLQRHWDKTLIDQLKGTIKIAGTPIGKEWSHQKPSDFPSQFIVLFETATFRKLGISWQPVLGSDGKAIIENNVIKDTAWELKVKYQAAGLTGYVLNARNTRFYHQGPFRALTGVIEYYDALNQLFGSHFGRGHTQGQAKFKSRLYQLPVLGRQLSRWQGRSQAQEWIKTCQHIIAQL